MSKSPPVLSPHALLSVPLYVGTVHRLRPLRDPILRRESGYVAPDESVSPGLTFARLVDAVSHYVAPDEDGPLMVPAARVDPVVRDLVRLAIKHCFAGVDPVPAPERIRDLESSLYGVFLPCLRASALFPGRIPAECSAPPTDSEFLELVFPPPSGSALVAASSRPLPDLQDPDMAADALIEQLMSEVDTAPSKPPPG